MAKREDVIKGDNTHPSVMKVEIKAKKVPLSEVPEEVKEKFKKKIKTKVKGSNPFADKLKDMLSKGEEDDE